MNTDYFESRIAASYSDRLLLKLTFSAKADEKDVTAILSGYDIETAPLGFTLLISNLLNRYPDIKISKDYIPRIKGVIRYFQCQNAALLAAFNKIVKDLNAAKIPVLMIKGIAMKYLNPDMPRYMADVDFAVPFNDFEAAVGSALRSGFKISVKADHSFDLYKGAQRIDLHRLIVKSYIDAKNTDSKIFSRAYEVNAFGVTAFIPRPEDLIFLTLKNAFENIIYSKPYPMKFLWIFDCARIIESVKIKNEKINWNIIVSSAHETGLLCTIKIMLELFERFMPGSVPGEVLSEINITPVQRAAFERSVRIHTLMRRCGEIKIAVKQILFSKNKKYEDIKRAVELTFEFFTLNLCIIVFLPESFCLLKQRRDICK